MKYIFPIISEVCDSDSIIIIYFNILHTFLTCIYNTIATMNNLVIVVQPATCEPLH